MSKLPEGDILELGLQIFKLIGEYVNRTPKKIYFYRVFNITVFGSILFFVLSNCSKESGVVFVKTLEGGITIIHIISKYVAFMYGKSGINSILLDARRFWIPRNIDSNLAKRCERIYGYTKIVQKILLFVILTSVQFHMLKPFFNDEDVFPFNVWITPDSFLTNLIVLMMEYYTLCICTAIVLSYDITYFSICIHVIVQLRLLKCKISLMSGNERKDLKICIEHHQLLYSIFGKMQEIYSWVLLLQYFMSLGMACVQLYILSTGKVETADTVELVLYLTTMYSEFGYYSIPVEEISSEFVDIARAVYMSKWYEKDSSSKRILQIIMINAQVPKYLSGGGLIQINMDTFGSVFRKSFSMYLVLKNLIK